MTNTITTLYHDYLRLANGDTTAASNLVLAHAMLAKPAAQQPAAADAPLAIADVARRLGVSRRVAYELCQDGEINTFKIGRAIRVQPYELAAYIERNTDRGPDALAAHRPVKQPNKSRLR